MFHKGPFPLRAWKRAFFVSFIDLRLKRAVKARFYYERGKKHSLFVLLLFFALASILTARFNRRSIKERKNALFHARSGNGPLKLKRAQKKSNKTNKECSFPLRAWKRAFFLSFIDLRLKPAVKIEASAKKSNKTNKECFFPRS